MVEIKERQKPLKKSVMFLLFDKGKLLLEERKDPTKSYYGYRIIPAGKVEEDELPEEALEREIYEECGVKPTKWVLLDEFEDITPRGNLYSVRAYLVTEFEGEISNREPNKVNHVWVSINEAREQLRFANSRYVLLLAEGSLNEEGLSRG